MDVSSNSVGCRATSRTPREAPRVESGSRPGVEHASAPASAAQNAAPNPSITNVAPRALDAIAAIAGPPKPPFSLAWLHHPLPDDFQIEFATDRRHVRANGPERVFVQGESRLFVHDSYPRCQIRCGSVKIAQLRALWSEVPAQQLQELIPNDGVAPAALWKDRQGRVRSYLFLHAHGGDYRLQPNGRRHVAAVQSWLDALSRLPLEEHQCPEMHISTCYAYPADVPFALQLWNVEPDSLDLRTRAGQVVMNTMTAAIWQCLQPDYHRRRFRGSHSHFLLHLSADSPSLEHVHREAEVEVKLSAKVMTCIRTSAPSWHVPPLPSDARVEFAVNEMCGAEPCEPEFVTEPSNIAGQRVY